MFWLCLFFLNNLFNLFEFVGFRIEGWNVGFKKEICCWFSSLFLLWNQMMKIEVMGQIKWKFETITFALQSKLQFT